MPTSIVFNDGSSATLTNGKPSPADRFSSWMPLTRPYGQTVHRQSDLTPTFFRLGTMYGAALELRMIPQRTSSTLRLVTIADRLIAHLLGGGSCTVNTGDVSSNSYSSCYLMPDTEPQLTFSDPGQLEYTLAVSLFNPGGTRMVCHYDV